MTVARGRGMGRQGERQHAQGAGQCSSSKRDCLRPALDLFPFLFFASVERERTCFCFLEPSGRPLRGAPRDAAPRCGPYIQSVLYLADSVKMI